MKYYIKKNGLPCWNNALKMPCSDKAAAQCEIERLQQLDAQALEEYNTMQAIPVTERGKGWAFLTPRPRPANYEIGIFTE